MNWVPARRRKGREEGREGGRPDGRGGRGHGRNQRNQTGAARVGRGILKREEGWTRGNDWSVVDLRVIGVKKLPRSPSEMY